MRFLLTPLREGRRLTLEQLEMRVHISTHAPAGGATSGAGANGIARSHFYSRPCGRGDAHGRTYGSFRQISTHAPAGGATPPLPGGPTTYSFLLTPLREGRHYEHIAKRSVQSYFYSRPCGRGDWSAPGRGCWKDRFLLTPLREGRLSSPSVRNKVFNFYSRPCGRGDAQTAGVSAVSTYFYSRPCGRGDGRILLRIGKLENFYSRPCGRGDDQWQYVKELLWKISTHAPAGGATGDGGKAKGEPAYISTHAPAGGATLWSKCLSGSSFNFYSRPCGRGDVMALENGEKEDISTHAPAGGATQGNPGVIFTPHVFLLTPLREGRLTNASNRKYRNHFYSRPCGRGDGCCRASLPRSVTFLLTPLREGRQTRNGFPEPDCPISTHAPAGGATQLDPFSSTITVYFYSRPCGRGDLGRICVRNSTSTFLLTPLREGRLTYSVMLLVV